MSKFCQVSPNVQKWRCTKPIKRKLKPSRNRRLRFSPASRILVVTQDSRNRGLPLSVTHKSLLRFWSTPPQRRRASGFRFLPYDSPNRTLGPQCKSRLSAVCIAGPVGIEPTISGLESEVIPFNYGPGRTLSRYQTTRTGKSTKISARTGTINV